MRRLRRWLRHLPFIRRLVTLEQQLDEAEQHLRVLTILPFSRDAHDDARAYLRRLDAWRKQTDATRWLN